MTRPEVGIEPVVNWPRRARRGGRYVVVADVRLSEPGDWPYQREEFVIGCVLEGGSAFSVEALGGTSLVLHRFGGTYGPVRFLVHADRDPVPTGADELRLTFLTEGGVPFRRVPLAVRPADGATDEWLTTPVEVLPRRPIPTPWPDAPGTPAAPATRRRDSLTILHLSHLGFFDHRAEPSAHRLYTRLPEGLRPDLVVVTGDLTRSARPREFAEAFALLADVSAATGVPRAHFAIVPGNRDVSRTRSQAYFLEMEADELEPTPPYFPKWRPFVSALDNFYAGTRDVSFTPDEPWTMFPMPELGVVVAGLNSTIAESHRPQDHYGFLGAAQLDWFAYRLTDFREHGWLRLAAVHHDPGVPESEAAGLADAADFVRSLGSSGLVNVVLHGTSTRDGALRRLPSGLPIIPAVGSPEDPVPGGQQRCQLISVTGDRLLRYSLRYKPEADRWVADTRTGTDLPDSLEIRLTDVDAALPATATQDRPVLPPELPAVQVGGVFDEVAAAAQVRFPRAVVIARAEAGYLRLVTKAEDGSTVEMRAVGVVDGQMTRAALYDFIERVHSRFASAAPRVSSDLVHTGPPTPDLYAAAQSRGVRLYTLAEYQLVVDLRPFLEQQRQALAEDRLYPPGWYVPQRFRTLLRGADGEIESGALEQITRWLSGPQARLVLVLGSFGTGKTTLARRLTQALSGGPADAVPILIELRDVERTRSLEELVALQLVRRGLESVELAGLRYMIRLGRVVLILDGFDELVTRTDYDNAADYLNVLLEAVGNRTKIVVTARTQHFRSTAQVLTALGERVSAASYTRVIELQDFDASQIRRFLDNISAGDRDAAETRFQLLSRVEGLAGLSRNPRMLSFIAMLPVDRIASIGQPARSVSAAGLYHEIIAAWIAGEVQRHRSVDRAGRLGEADLLAACTALARSRWRTARSLASVTELSGAVAATLEWTAEGFQTLGQTAHVVGSGSLLVRTEDGQFTFVHESVEEWLVARAAADDLAHDGTSTDLGVRPFSPLMIDFLCDPGDVPVLERWSTTVLAAADADEVIRVNALAVAARLRIVTDARPLLLDGRDLRDADLSGRDLRGEDLRGARLFDVDLSGADLRDADFSGARLMGGRLSGAATTGSRWAGAALLGVEGAETVWDRSEFAQAAVAGRDVAGPKLAGPFPAASLSFSPDGRLLACAAGGKARVWDVGTAGFRHTVEHSSGPVTRVAFSPHGDLATMSMDPPEVMLWEGAMTFARQVGGADTGSLRVLAFASNGHLLAVGSEDGTVRLWHPHTGAAITVIAGHTAAVTAVAVSPDGTRLATASGDGSARLWDSDGRVAGRLGPTVGVAVDVAFAPDGAAVITATRDGTIEFRDVGGWRAETIRLHLGAVTAFAVSPAGDLIAAADGATVVIADISTGRPQTIEAGGRVSSIAFAPDGRLLATGSADGLIHLWRVPSFSPAATLLTARDGWAASFPDGSYKLAGDVGDALRWTMNGQSFAPGELDRYVPEIRRRGFDEPAPS